MPKWHRSDFPISLVARAGHSDAAALPHVLDAMQERRALVQDHFRLTWGAKLMSLSCGGAGPSWCAAASILVCAAAAWVGRRLGRYHGRLAAAGEAAHAHGDGGAAAPVGRQGPEGAVADEHRTAGLAGEGGGKAQPLSRPSSAAWREQVLAVKDGSPQLRRQRSSRE